MSNEEIRLKIAECQKEIYRAMQAGTFELNATVEKYKNKINSLRNQCTHKNETGASVFTGDGRCVYCNKKVK